MASLKRRTQNERRDEAEERLLRAGVALLAERGLDGITLGEVGAAAGYSRGLPAHYFVSKQKFQETILQYISNEFRGRFLLEPTRPGLSSLIELIQNCFVQSGKDPISLHILQIMLSDPAGKPTAMQLGLAPIRAEAYALYERHVREGVKKGEIKHDNDPAMVTRIIISALCGALRVAFISRSSDPVSVGRELVQFVTRALAASSPTAGE